MYCKGTILNALIQFYTTRHRVNCCYTNFLASVVTSNASCGENLTLSFQKREKTERIIQKMYNCKSQTSVLFYRILLFFFGNSDSNKIMF